MATTPSDEPPGQPREPRPDAATAETSEVPAATPAGAAPAEAPSAQPSAGHPLPSAGYPPPSPFAPIARAPRVPWVNPDRRSHLLGAGIIGGVLVLAAGFGIGYAAAPSGHDRYGPLRMDRGYFQPRMAPHGQFPGPIGGYGPRPQRGLPSGAPSPTVPTMPAVAPTPAPSRTK